MSRSKSKLEREEKTKTKEGRRGGNYKFSLV
jgi:hypothetical protein